MRAALFLSAPQLVLTYVVFFPDQFDTFMTWAGSFRQ